jgi:hypothetical protein
MQGLKTDRKIKVVHSRAVFGLQGRPLGVLHGTTDKYYQFWDGDDLLRVPKIWAEIIEVEESQYSSWS